MPRGWVGAGRFVVVLSTKWVTGAEGEEGRGRGRRAKRSWRCGRAWDVMVEGWLCRLGIRGVGGCVIREHGSHNPYRSTLPDTVLLRLPAVFRRSSKVNDEDGVYERTCKDREENYV